MYNSFLVIVKKKSLTQVKILKIILENNNGNKIKDKLFR